MNNRMDFFAIISVRISFPTLSQVQILIKTELIVFSSRKVEKVFW